MGDSTLTIILAFVATQVAAILAFARFYFELRKDLKLSVEQVKATYVTLNELKQALAEQAQQASPIVVETGDKPLDVKPTRPKKRKEL